MNKTLAGFWIFVAHGHLLFLRAVLESGWWGEAQGICLMEKSWKAEALLEITSHIQSAREGEGDRWSIAMLDDLYRILYGNSRRWIVLPSTDKSSQLHKSLVNCPVRAVNCLSHLKTRNKEIRQEPQVVELSFNRMPLPQRLGNQVGAQMFQAWHEIKGNKWHEITFFKWLILDPKTFAIHHLFWSDINVASLPTIVALKILHLLGVLMRSYQNDR